MRLIYSVSSGFLKVFVFFLTVFTAYRVNVLAEPTLGAWITVPFVCLAIIGAKYAVEAADAFFRRKLGYAVAEMDD